MTDQVQPLGGQHREASERSKRIWYPKTLRVPVPVRSPLSTPWCQDVVQEIEVLPHAEN